MGDSDIDKLSLMPNITAIIMDRGTRTVTLLRTDRKEAHFPMPASMFESESLLANTVYFPNLHLLQLNTLRGDSIVAEIPNNLSSAPLNGRPVVYLDQKDWSLLANSMHRPDLVSGPEKEAAEGLRLLAQKKKIILPLSSGHVSETLKWSNDEARYRLALTMAQLSAGWQMRDPLVLRRLELRKSFTRKFKHESMDVPAAFTLEPFALHGELRGDKTGTASSDLPDALAIVATSLTSVMAHFDTLLNHEKIEMGASPGWVDKNQGFTEWLAGESRESQQKRQSIDVLFLNDAQNEIAEEAVRTGISTEDLSNWIIAHRAEEVPTMQSLGLFREVLMGRHLNQTTHWRNNDLTDLIYLTGAAGYADYVVAERHMVNHISQAQRRLGRPVNVYRRLSELLAALKDSSL